MLNMLIPLAFLLIDEVSLDIVYWLELEMFSWVSLDGLHMQQKRNKWAIFEYIENLKW